MVWNKFFSVLSGLLIGGIGEPDASSLLDLDSTSKGSRPFPRMTEAQRDAIVSPAQGLVIYNTDSGTLNVFNGESWGELSGSGGGSSGVNYETDPYFQNYKEGDWTVQGDDTGVTFTVDPEDESILGPALPGIAIMAKDAANRDAQGRARVYAIGQASRDAGQVCLSGFYISPTTGLSTGDVKLTAYDLTNGVPLTINGITDGKLGAVAAGKVKRFLVRIPISSNTANLGLAYVWNDGSTVAKDIGWTGLKVGPDEFAPVPIDRQVEINCAGSGAFTTGTIIATRVGRIVTLTVNNSIGVSDANNAPASAAGLIPEWARPNGPVRNVYRNYGGVNREIIANADGSVQFGFSVAQTSSGACSISYSVTDSSSAVMSTTALMNETAKVMLTSSNGPAIGTSFTKITFNNVVQDSLGLVSSGTFTAPATLNYDILGHLNTAPVAFSVGHRILVAAYVNGVADKYVGVDRAGAAGTTNREIAISGTVRLNKGDTLEIYAASSVATALEASASGNHISIQARQDSTVYGAYSEPNRVQTKMLASNVTTGGVISGLTFTGLTAGKRYVGRFQGAIVTTAADAFDLVVRSGSTTVADLTFTTSTGTMYDTKGTSFSFTSDGGSLTVTGEGMLGTTTIRGNGSKLHTFLELEERNDLIETTAW